MNPSTSRPFPPFLILDQFPEATEVVIWGGRKFVRLPSGGWAMVEGDA